MGLMTLGLMTTGLSRTTQNGCVRNPCHFFQDAGKRHLLPLETLARARGFRAQPPCTWHGAPSSKGNRNPTFKVLLRSRGKMGPTQIKHPLKTKLTCPYTHMRVDNHCQACGDACRGCRAALQKSGRHLGRFLEGGGFRAEEGGPPHPQGGSSDSFPSHLLGPFTQHTVGAQCVRTEWEQEVDRGSRQGK